MKRVMLALCVIGSFNVVAIQLFMAGNIGPLANILPYQQALIVTAFFTVVVDIVLIYLMMTIGGTSSTPQGEFDQIFKRYYNGKNYEEAFEKARKEWKSRL
jgi:hypothetical protein